MIEAIKDHGYDKSLPSRERGLKLGTGITSLTEEMVAPFAGAWIEIQPINALPAPERSLPSRERGLKYTQENPVKLLWWSLPSRERGLK